MRLYCVVVLLFAGSARADWLVELPAHETGARHESTPTELVYPRPGLPALAEPGEHIVARVRVPAPLMPAPGIQQPRALRGWSAELVGHSTPLDEGAQHRYALRVLDIRADGASGLVFRATVRVPPWAAPGTYTFRIDSPGSVIAAAPGSVRVLVPGRAPIVASYADHEDHDTWDVDVWLASDVREPLAGHGVPWLDPEIEARFSHSLEPVEPSARIESFVFLETRDRVVGEGEWFAATNVRPTGVRPAIVLRTTSRPTGERAGECAPLSLNAPDETVVDVPIQLEADAVSGWAFEEDGSVFGSDPQIRLRWIGVQEVHALAVEEGCARRGQVAVRVEPALKMGCSAANPSGILWFFGLLCTIAARRYKPRRNRCIAAKRSPPEL